MWLQLVLILVVGTIYLQRSDALAELNPLACEYEELRGRWVFEMGERGNDKTINCASKGRTVQTYNMLLDYPDVAKDEFGNVGFWTMVDSLGIEVILHGRKFFAFIKFKTRKDGRETRFCNETMFGQSHNVLGDDWACFFGRKVQTSPRDAIKEVYEREERSSEEVSKRQSLNRLYRTEVNMIDAINTAQSSWTATSYEEYDTMTVEELLARAGNRVQRKSRISPPAPITKEQEKLVADLPDSFDWRNVKGINYISPPRDQGKCGSCYAFTSVAMNEARLAIYTNRTIQVSFSPQDIVDCSRYSLGCNGGSSYAIAGIYGEDFGMVEESCNPYKGIENSRCGTKTSCQRYYFTGYEFVGGYYGACNEAQMLIDLVRYGPLAIAIKVNEDLMFYKSGVYQPTGISSKFNPFVEVDHAVTLVGYGIDKTHGKYWIIKNSWGTKWGDGGYFRLRRGINDCGVESDAMQSFPIF